MLNVSEQIALTTASHHYPRVIFQKKLMYGFVIAVHLKKNARVVMEQEYWNAIWLVAYHKILFRITLRRDLRN